jgi:hypothetical protein
MDEGHCTKNISYSCVSSEVDGHCME